MVGKRKKDMNKWAVMVVVIAALFLLSIVLSSVISFFAGDSGAGNTAMINVKGPIIVSRSTPFSEYASSSDITGFIEEADQNPAVRAIIINVNSPGGSAVASDEIARAVREANKTTVAVIRDVGASGGYWVASAADHIIANSMSMTGSVGVFSSYLEFSGLLDRFNVSYERLVAGEYKDIGTPLRELKPEEKRMLQSVLDSIHEEFVSSVAENRNLSEEQVEEIRTGMFFTGRKARELGLVDELGGMPEAESYIRENLNITPSIRNYGRDKGIIDIFSGVISRQSFSIGQGVGSMLDSRRAGITV